MINIERPELAKNHQWLWCRKCGDHTPHKVIDLVKVRKLYQEECCTRCATTLRCVNGNYINLEVN